MSFFHYIFEEERATRLFSSKHAAGLKKNSGKKESKEDSRDEKKEYSK